ncbi:MAG: ankyrin repeat domain-containing protein [Candidatus Dependentiae bacterium]
MKIILVMLLIPSFIGAMELNKSKFIELFDQSNNSEQSDALKNIIQANQQLAHDVFVEKLTHLSSGYVYDHNKLKNKYARDTEHQKKIDELICMLKNGLKPPFPLLEGNVGAGLFDLVRRDEIGNFKKAGKDIKEPVLHVALRKGTPELIKELIQAGVDVNETDSEGFTSLMSLMMFGNLRDTQTRLSILQELVKANVAINAMYNHKTALDIAQSASLPEHALITALKNEGAKTYQELDSIQ